ncbi:MAG TPA: hypothetical protein VGO62_21210 [Myxococcota bacterium]|jgi:hypothetical protein
MDAAKGLTVKMQLVADIAKKGEGAKVVKNAPVAPVQARVDITTDVDTGGAFDKKSGSADGTRTIGNGAPVGAGGGVVGFRIQSAREAPPLANPDALSTAELRALLAPYTGRSVVVTNYDRDAGSLARAVKQGDVADTRGVLMGVSDDGIQLKKDGKVNTVQKEFWVTAQIRLDDHEQTALARDPDYSKHYAS